MRNFNVPYFSRSIAEFWRRWHISLNTWFVDYVYIPLGGSRGKKSKTIRNTIIIFLLSGLWHGADWTFVAWGAYNAILFIPLTLTESNKKHIDTVAADKTLPTMSESLLMAWTFLLVIIGWVIFRSDNISIAFDYLARMFTDFHFSGNLFGVSKFSLLLVIVMFLIEWLQRHKNHPFEITGEKIFRHRVVRWITYWTFAMVIFMLHGNQSEFIYFQF